jgi:hypothetical protein
VWIAVLLLHTLPLMMVIASLALDVRFLIGVTGIYWAVVLSIWILGSLSSRTCIFIFRLTPSPSSPPPPPPPLPPPSSPIFSRSGGLESAVLVEKGCPERG